MVETVQRFKAHDGREFASQTAALQHEAVEAMIDALPELRLIETRLRANLMSFAPAVARAVSTEANTTLEPAGETTLEEYHFDPTGWVEHPLKPVAEDHGELAGLCDCSAGFSGADDHAVSCPKFNPASLPRGQWGTADVRHLAHG